MGAIDRLGAWLTDAPRALYALAACRIGTGLAVLGMLVSNFESRTLWVGPASVWVEPARSASQFPEIAILNGVTSDLLAVVFVMTALSAFAFVIGWHTKTANAVTLIGFIAIVAQNPVVGGQVDNVVRLTLLWMLLTQSGQRWSIDARAHVPDTVVPPWLRSGLHHVGLIGLGAQTALLYLAAGLNKASDTAWQHGNALYYTLQLPDYRPLPWLSDALSSSAVVLAILTYGVLLIQLFFVPFLVNDVSRRIVVVSALVMGAFTGVVFAEPWTALSVMAATLVFADESALLRVGDWISDRWFSVLDRTVGLRYAFLDRLDDLRYSLIFPVVDWIAVRIPRRR